MATFCYPIPVKEYLESLFRLPKFITQSSFLPYLRRILAPVYGISIEELLNAEHQPLLVPAHALLNAHAMVLTEPGLPTFFHPSSINFLQACFAVSRSNQPCYLTYHGVY